MSENPSLPASDLIPEEATACQGSQADRPDRDNPPISARLSPDRSHLDQKAPFPDEDFENGMEKLLWFTMLPPRSIPFPPSAGVNGNMPAGTDRQPPEFGAQLTHLLTPLIRQPPRQSRQLEPDVGADA